MAENLNAGTRIDGSQNQMDNGVNENIVTIIWNPIVTFMADFINGMR